MSFSATYFGANGWLLEFGEVRILIDPWLKGELIFPPGDWMIKGCLRNQFEIPQDLSFLLLTQGLADHSHVPTLKDLPRSLKIIASPSASKVVKKLGFVNVFSLGIGDEINLNEVSVTASAGAPVPRRENGYLLRHLKGSVYIEPHGFIDQNLFPCLVDAVISPLDDVSLPVAGAFIRGKTVLSELVSRFNPLTFLASTTGGEVEFSGVLSKLIKVSSSRKHELGLNYEGVHFIDPHPGKKYSIPSR